MGTLTPCLSFCSSITVSLLVMSLEFLFSDWWVNSTGEHSNLIHGWTVRTNQEGEFLFCFPFLSVSFYLHWPYFPYICQVPENISWGHKTNKTCLFWRRFSTKGLFNELPSHIYVRLSLRSSSCLLTSDCSLLRNLIYRSVYLFWKHH